MSTSSDASSSSDDGHLPRGIPKRRRGWDGEEMELQRDDTPTEASHAAVDLQQFRNTEVGKGYQAKHVVRQRTGMESRSVEKVKDLTTSSRRKKEHSKRSSKKSKKRKKRPSSPSEKPAPEDLNSDRLRRYLKCDGLRKFRRELESIVRES